MEQPTIVTREAWLKARLELLEKEKAFTRARDALSAERRALPWVKIDKPYLFASNNGPRQLSELFGGHKQLLVYHFMFHPDWQAGCKSCSFWADNYDNIIVHLRQRDTQMVTISRAPLEKLNAFKARMGWQFDWLSSLQSDFNQDFQASFSEQQVAEKNCYYNYRQTAFAPDEAPGLSVFVKDEAGQVYHSYSCYSRGLDILNTAYNHLDLTPAGRNEDELPFTMAWVRHHDDYA